MYAIHFLNEMARGTSFLDYLNSGVGDPLMKDFEMTILLTPMRCEDSLIYFFIVWIKYRMKAKKIFDRGCPPSHCISLIANLFRIQENRSHESIDGEKYG